MLLIRYLRLRKGLSQQRLAALADTRQATISAIERAQCQPGDALLCRIAAALDVAPAFTLLRPVDVEQQVTYAGTAQRVAL